MCKKIHFKKALPAKVLKYFITIREYLYFYVSYFMRTIVTPIAQIHFDDFQRILYVKVSDDAEMNLHNAKIHFEKINNLVGLHEYVALVDASNFYTIESDAWKYASSKIVVSNRKAVAQYNCSLANRLTTVSYSQTLKTSMPVRIFGSKEDAIIWLKRFL